ncbi:phospholipase D family protein [Noviherbaspirillum cavernae]|uniref:Phospholipase D family protein n=1 Tax=Noviherbaspirillum cavernae TaxID=2320862 RepID=A0A418WZN6_9BURK|nr:phospholipase D family protein [Noviherbaspirillum cavernae]RJG05717.1 phospholipase D family protein [Noviherbaspirillum cavernae]
MDAQRVSGSASWWLVMLLACLLSACAGLPKVERQESYVVRDTVQTRLGQAAAPQLEAHPGQSGFFPLVQGIDAFAARMSLARAAQRTLDLQYYIFHDDQTGLALIGELLAAAERGVRVRVLVDDIHTEGKDRSLAIADSHPNIEVRLFNPFAHRNARWLDFVGDFRRVNRRMHNKSMTADNQATIVGGRNIGDEYFSAKTDVDFSDFDILALGPVVTEVSAQFDAYWNSAHAYPASAFNTGAPIGPDDYRELRARVEERAASLRNTAYANAVQENELTQDIKRGEMEAYWGTATVIADPPDKLLLSAESSPALAITKLAKVLAQAQRELVLMSPYFVPGPRGVQWLQDMIRRGVHVKIITNSFAATDVQAVHAGYTTYRTTLLKAGVELYEMKPTAYSERARQGRQRGLTGSSRASLHAKTYMTDRRTLFVGSLNLDGRSAMLNTEMGVVLENEALCKMLHDNLTGDILDVAYRVQLVTDAQTGNQHLTWITREDGKEVIYDSEPEMSAFQKVIQGVLKILPIEEQL